MAIEAHVPLRNRMGAASNVACPALFRHSDEAGFISGIWLPVNGATWANHGHC